MLTRWGGEEFILIIPNTNLEQACVALARLRTTIFGQRPIGAPALNLNKQISHNNFFCCINVF